MCNGQKNPENQVSYIAHVNFKDLGFELWLQKGHSRLSSVDRWCGFLAWDFLPLGTSFPGIPNREMYLENNRLKLMVIYS